MQSAEQFFDNEVRSLEKLNHDNIVKVVAHGTAKLGQEFVASEDDEGTQFIALEYIDGVELIDFLMIGGALPELVARHVF